MIEHAIAEQKKLFIMKSEKISFYSHVLGAILALAGGVVLVGFTPEKSWERFVVIVYIFSVCWLFCASSIYHAQKRTESSMNIWRKFDHFAIFFMIAGTYTPLCYYTLTGPMRTGIIIAQWSLVACGILFKLFYMRAPRWLYTAIYVLMGWMAVIPMRDLIHSMSALSFCLLMGGGVVYTVGAVIYAKKRPNPFPGIFGFHEIFHVLIVIAAVLHFGSVFVVVTQGG
jgi:hemolysin III